MTAKHALIAAAAGALIAPAALLSTTADPANAHGYVWWPASRQAICAQAKMTNCGDAASEPQNVTGKKGLRACDAGSGRFSKLSDAATNWPATRVSGVVRFSWVLTGRRPTAGWEYYIDDTRIAVFDGKGALPGVLVEHRVDLTAFSGRKTLLAIWNSSDADVAHYSCVDLEIGTGPPTAPPPSSSAPTTTKSAPPTSSSTPGSQTASSAPPPPPPDQDPAWAPNTKYNVGDKVTHQDGTFSCRQTHTSLPGWEPSAAPSLWQRES